MKTLKMVSIGILFLIMGTGLYAQNENNKSQGTGLSINKSTYMTAIGLRLGGTSGLTFKHFLSSHGAFEGILGARPSSLSFTALYEYHTYAGLPGLYWFFGGGGHAVMGAGNIYYTYTNDHGYYQRTGYYGSGEFGAGIDGILGLEYKIPPVPFALDLNLKPYFEIRNSGVGFMSFDPGIGIKVAF